MCVIRKAVMKMTIDGNPQWNVTIELYRRSRCGTLLTQVVPRLLCRYPKMCINHFFCFCYLFCLGHFPFLSHFMLILLLVSRYQFLVAVFGTTLMHLIHPLQSPWCCLFLCTHFPWSLFSVFHLPKDCRGPCSNCDRTHEPSSEISIT